MLEYIGRRALLAVFTVWAISVLAFVIIQLPPGDYVTSYIAQMAASGSVVSEEEANNLRIQYGLGRPIYVQYYKWVRLFAEGNFGMSMEWKRPVTEVIGDRLWLTMVVAMSALLLTWVLALPIGIYSAVRQYSLGDYAASPWSCSISASPSSTPISGGCSLRTFKMPPGAWPRPGTCSSISRSPP
jgi:peptide/nickel transport system permease protein